MGDKHLPRERIGCFPKHLPAGQRGNEQVRLQGAHCAGVEVDYEIYDAEDDAETAAGLHVEPIEPRGVSVGCVERGCVREVGESELSRCSLCGGQYCETLCRSRVAS